MSDVDPPLMDQASERFDQAIAAIDAVNATDPTVIVIDGVEAPKELGHARLVTEWVRRLDPDADEAQLLAARAHHLRRWAIPRKSYPEGRAGYLRWRTEQKKRHVEDVAVILAGVGYDERTIDRVQTIIGKQGRSTDRDVQTHEDALCLVFLSTQLRALADDLGEDRTIEVLRKTAAKMSGGALEIAATIPFDDVEQALLGRALNPAVEPPTQ